MLLSQMLPESKNSVAPKDIVKNWLRGKSAIEFLGLLKNKQ